MLGTFSLRFMLSSVLLRGHLGEALVDATSRPLFSCQQQFLRCPSRGGSFGAAEVDQLAEGLPSMPEALASIPGTAETKHGGACLSS